MKLCITSLFLLCSYLSAWAEPGGKYILTGNEKNLTEIIEADMSKYPELYKGETLASYTSKFKKENNIGKRKLSPGDVLFFPATKASHAIEGETTATDFLNALESGDITVMKQYYAEEVLLLSGSQLLKEKWGLNSSGNRYRKLYVCREDLMAAYKEYIDYFGLEKWKRYIGSKTMEIDTDTDRNEMLLTVGWLEFNFQLNDETKKWEIVSEKTDY